MTPVQNWPNPNALQRVRPSRHCCNPCVPWAGSLSFCRWRHHTIMENIQTKQTSTEALGYTAGVSVGTFRALFRGKHISAAIIVLVGAILLLGGSWLIRHDDT